MQRLVSSDNKTDSGKTYSIELKKSVDGHKYIVITDSCENFQNRIIISEENFQSFFNELSGLRESLGINKDFTFSQIKKDSRLGYKPWINSEDEDLTKLMGTKVNQSELSSIYNPNFQLNQD